MFRKFLVVSLLLCFAAPAFARTITCTGTEAPGITIVMSAKVWTKESNAEQVSFKMLFGGDLFVSDKKASLADSPEVVGARLLFPGSTVPALCMVIFEEGWRTANMTCYDGEEQNPPRSFGSFVCTE